jgi:hypothetical protein
MEWLWSMRVTMDIRWIRVAPLVAKQASVCLAKRMVPFQRRLHVSQWFVEQLQQSRTPLSCPMQTRSPFLQLFRTRARRASLWMVLQTAKGHLKSNAQQMELLLDYGLASQ